MSEGPKISPGYLPRNKVQLVRGGKEYFTLLERLISEAMHSVFIRVYIWDDDTTGTRIADQLINASKRGIPVHIVADGYASQRLSKSFVRRLRDNNIRFRFFEPLLKSSHFYFGRRMHEKMVVIDGQHALIGGINFADRYNDVDNIEAWLDYAVLVQGNAAVALYNNCLAEWKIKLPPPPATYRQDQCLVRLRHNDWVKRKRQVWQTYFDWISRSQETVTIMCSYFLPGRTLRNQLFQAAKRGVRVQLILAGPSDVMIAKFAERHLYQSLLRAGIRIFEYQPTVLHAKLMVVDKQLVTIGSFNVNNVSAYASLELNVDIDNREFAQHTQSVMDTIIVNDCIEIKESKRKTSFLSRFAEKVSYETVRLLINLATFYFKPE
jgi:cardiolipin synthase A/B